MITYFKHKGLEFFSPKEAEDMDLPGYKFHALKGDRKGEYAVSVTGNWRITFELSGDDAMSVNLEDYH